MKRIQRIKIVTAQRHHDTAALRKKPDKKEKPADAENRDKKINDAVRAFLNQRNKTRRKEIKIHRLEGG